MKLNKAVFMTFATNSSSATVTINVPFNVKTIHCKAIGYMTSTAPAIGHASYLYIVSDLTQNTPIAMVFQDSTYPYSPGTDIEYIFQTPQPVNGNYTFTLISFTGLPNLATVGGDQVGLILEFNDENETR